MTQARTEIRIEQGRFGHSVAIYKNGDEVHRTIDYPERHWAEKHAQQFHAQIRDSVVVGRSTVDRGAGTASGFKPQRRQA